MIKSEHFLKDNLIFLFNLNKKINNLKKSHFCDETKVKRTALYNWIQGNHKPTDSNLQLMTNYFNKWLKLTLTIDNLLYDDIKTIMNHHATNLIKKEMLVKEPDNIYINSKQESELVLHFRRLDNKKKEIILNLIKELS